MPQRQRVGGQRDGPRAQPQGRVAGDSGGSGGPGKTVGGMAASSPRQCSRALSSIRCPEGDPSSSASSTGWRPGAGRPAAAARTPSAEPATRSSCSRSRRTTRRLPLSAARCDRHRPTTTIAPSTTPTVARTGHSRAWSKRCEVTSASIRPATSARSSRSVYASTTSTARLPSASTVCVRAPRPAVGAPESAGPASDGAGACACWKSVRSESCRATVAVRAANTPSRDAPGGTSTKSVEL